MPRRNGSGRHPGTHGPDGRQRRARVLVVPGRVVGTPPPRRRDRRLHVRQPAGAAAAGPGRCAPAQRRAPGQGLVRVQDERGGAAHGRGRVAPSADGDRLSGRGRRDDGGRVRGAGRDDPGGVRRRRRGHLPLAAVVLLRADDRVGRRDGGARRPRRARLRPRRRRHRRRDHAADPRDHRQHAAQPHRPDLPRARAARAGRRPAGGVRAPRPADRPALRRVVQPDRVRRHRVPQPGARLRRDRADLHLRQDHARAGPADRVRRPPPVVPGRGRRSATGSSSSSWPRAGASRTPCSSTRSATSRGCRSTSPRSRPGATGWSRRCARWATR